MPPELVVRPDRPCPLVDDVLVHPPFSDRSRDAFRVPALEHAREQPFANLRMRGIVRQVVALVWIAREIEELRRLAVVVDQLPVALTHHALLHGAAAGPRRS